MVKDFIKKISWGAMLASPLFWAIVLGIALLFIIGGYIDSCRSSKREEKKGNINANLIITNVEINALQQNKNAINGDLQNQSANANASLNAVNEAKNQGVNGKSNSYKNANSRYCARFPNDEGCRQN